MNEAFWAILEELIENHEVIIDRPRGSRHPRYPHIIYEMDYGYLKGTKSMDGAGIDLWRGSEAEGKLKGIICTADRIKGDVEIKLLIGCTQEEMAYAERFHNDSDNMKGLLILRDKQEEIV